MPSRVNLTDLNAMEAAAIAQAAEKKKKRPVANVYQYELKRLRKGSQVEVEFARVEIETTPIVKGSIPIEIPLTEVLGKSSASTVQVGARMTYSLEPARDRICSALVLGDCQRFERLSLPNLVG